MKKKKIFIILLFISICFVCFLLGFLVNEKVIKNKSQEQDNTNQVVENGENDELIKTPDRIVFKYESKYYEITPDYEKYDELVNICRENISEAQGQNISESEIDSMKGTAKFIEFDYNTISKNNIFFLTSNVGAIQMRDKDGVVISNKLNNIDKIVEAFLEAIEGKEGYSMNSELIRAITTYPFLPATNDFKIIKDNKVYAKQLDSYEDFEIISNQYNFKFDSLENIEAKFEGSKAILILAKYDISDFKANIGNIKINFSGKDYLTPNGNTEVYTPMLVIVSKVVNTNCIYYNYDSVKMEDNLTGTIENISGVVKSKDADEIVISYTTNDDFELGKIMLSSRRILNSTADEIKVGDFITGSATVTGIENNVKSYEAKEISVQPKEEYDKLLLDNLKGKNKISTTIVDYWSAESNYDGYVICEVYYGENSYEPDAYVKIYYDFYEGNTESYLGMGRHIESDYGIVPHEMVDITFKEPVEDISNIKAKMFEYIAD